MAKRHKGVDRAAQALATAGGIAHITFLGLFGWKILTGGMLMRFGWIFATLAAALGLLAEIVGWMLVKHSGPTPARKLGYVAIAASTGIAAVLLLIASW